MRRPYTAHTLCFAYPQTVNTAAFIIHYFGLASRKRFGHPNKVATIDHMNSQLRQLPGAVHETDFFAAWRCRDFAIANCDYYMLLRFSKAYFYPTVALTQECTSTTSRLYDQVDVRALVVRRDVPGPFYYA
jgi:hypothetical protein